MCEMTKELQEQLWAEASVFVENGSRKHLAKLGVTLEGSDIQMSGFKSLPVTFQ